MLRTLYDLPSGPRKALLAAAIGHPWHPSKPGARALVALRLTHRDGSLTVQGYELVAGSPARRPGRA